MSGSEERRTVRESLEVISRQNNNQTTGFLGN